MDCIFRPFWKTISHGNVSQLLPGEGKLAPFGSSSKGTRPPYPRSALTYTSGTRLTLVQGIPIDTGVKPSRIRPCFH